MMVKIHSDFFSRRWTLSEVVKQAETSFTSFFFYFLLSGVC